MLGLSLQIVGFDAVVTPGLQWQFSEVPDNANTYTHRSNLTALNFQHFINNNWNMKVALGRLFTNLRADANGRPFRSQTVDQIFDPESIVTGPVSTFNPEGSVIIQADKASKTGFLVETMDQVRLAGVQNVSIAASQD